MARRMMAWGAVLAALALSISGCELLYFAGGKGTQKALFTFSKTQKVLVLAEVRTEVPAPPYVANNLADSVGKHLWKYRAVEKLITQDTVMMLQAKDPEEFKKMGIADIAEAAGADAVLVVNITKFITPTTTDGSVSEGYAEAYVKVVDKHGVNLFGGTGIHLMAHDSEAMVGDRDLPRTVQDLINQLSIQTGRLFHDYNVEDAEMNPTHLDPNRQMGHPGE